MSGTEYRSSFRNRVYTRKFDHDEARIRHAAGESIKALACEYGVSPAAVRRVVNPRVRARMELASEAWLARHGGNPSNYDTCTCGKRKRKGARRCRECEIQARSVGPPVDRRGRVLCHDCRLYLPVLEFPFDPRHPDRAFRRHQCRSCEAKRRQDYRERHKVPCIGCGKPTLPPSEKRTYGSGLARCQSCAARAAAAARGWKVRVQPPAEDGGKQSKETETSALHP